jgi:hypothetical protein
MTISNDLPTFTYESLVAFDELKNNPIDTNASVIRKIKDFIRARGMLHYRFEGGNTALHFATQHGKINVIKALHFCGADWTIENDEGVSSEEVLNNNEHLAVLINAFRKKCNDHPDWVDIFYNKDSRAIRDALADTPKAKLDAWRGEDGENLFGLAGETGHLAELRAVYALSKL